VPPRLHGAMVDDKRLVIGREPRPDLRDSSRAMGGIGGVISKNSRRLFVGYGSEGYTESLTRRP